MTNAPLEAVFIKKEAEGSGPPRLRFSIPAAIVRPRNIIAARLFMAILALAPLPFGSADKKTTAFWCFCLALNLALCDPGALGKEQRRIVFCAMLVLAVFVLFAGIQMLSPPWLGRPHPLWRSAADVLGGDVQSAISVMRYAPLYSLGSSIACVLSLSVGLILARDPRRAHQILMVFAWSGLVYAAYGIVSALLEPNMILWQEREGYFGNVIGTFTYRNTAAVYFGSCGAVWFLKLCEIIKTRLPAEQLNWKNFYREFGGKGKASAVICFIGFFVCVAALLMSASRAGTVISIGVLIGAVAVYFRKNVPTKGRKLLLVGAALCFALFILNFLGGAVNQRFNTAGFEDEYRLNVYKAALRMIAAQPWWGTGLGTFPWAFPEFRSVLPSIYGVWNVAHSTPLELAIEMGIPLTSIIVLVWLCVLGVLGRGALIRRRDRRIPLTALSVALIGLFHSCIDFSLQIPGFSIVAMAMIGAGLAQSFPQHRNGPL